VTIFGNDASKWQGNVSWDQVDQTMEFGFEKVSEGPGKGIPNGYVSERWRPEKPEMAARAEASGFIPGGYLFLAEGNGARQADFFADAAGDMSGFAIVVDVEPREPLSHPTMIDARSCVARLRSRYPGHPIGGYIAPWFWGNQDTTFVDYVWKSRYVPGGPAPAATLYSRVPASYWAGYGGSQVSLLQFTDKALIAGVDGPCDCSAYRGTTDQLRQLVLGAARAAAAAGWKELDMPGLINQGKDAKTPVAIPNGAKRLRLFSNQAAQVRIDFVGEKVPATVTLDLSYDKGPQGAATGDAKAAVLTRLDEGLNDVSMVISA
jgi:GH25 family lysozyme M1 (1,4-beta-N-acetylmuramidase)